MTVTARTTDLRGRFRALHRDGIFVMPNPWDVGSARLLASMGFAALATTSSGHAASIGKTDQSVTRDELLAHVERSARAVDVPINVDAERCFADDPAGVAETVELIARAGARAVRSRTTTRRPGRSTPSRRPSSASAAAAERPAATGRADGPRREPPVRHRRPRGHHHPVVRLP